MKILRPILFASLLALASPLLAQEAHPYHGGAVAASSAPEVDSIAPAPAGKGGCEKCKQSGMGDKMAGGEMGEMGGMSCCKGKHGGGSGMGGKPCGGGMHGGGDTVALERRISELEKRLDLMQQHTTR
ncbi:hypothetical protein [Thiobacillus sp.]